MKTSLSVTVKTEHYYLRKGRINSRVDDLDQARLCLMRWPVRLDTEALALKKLKLKKSVYPVHNTTIMTHHPIEGLEGICFLELQCSSTHRHGKN